jgi:hypothetical protein
MTRAGQAGIPGGRRSRNKGADRREPLVVLPLRLAAEIAVAAERKR